MKNILCALMWCWLANVAVAADSAWLTSLPEASAQAKKEGKLVLLNFTGSDWCPGCKRFAAEVFPKPEFLAYAKSNLVLVEVDFPLSKKQPAALEAANTALQDKYKVEGYPTLILLQPDGKVVWRNSGFISGGPEGLVARLDAARKK